MRLIKPRRIADDRGWFAETYHQHRYLAEGVSVQFRQDNQVYSRAAGTLRGLHFQAPPHPQAKLVSCLRGSVWDVAVDLRAGSPTYGTWEAAELSADNGLQAFIPVGYAHGYVTLEDDTEVEYKVSDFYSPECEGGVIWNDPDLALPWPFAGAAPVLSDKDRRLPRFADLQTPFVFESARLFSLETP